MTILKIEPYKRPETIELDGNLESMQSIVGGLIQAIHPFKEPVALVCNDEGKLLDLPANRVLVDPETDDILDIIFGTFFLCGAPADAENFTSLTPEQIKTYTDLFYDPEIILRTSIGVLVTRIREIERN